MLSPEEARNFIENGLGIRNLEDKLHNDPLSALNSIIFEYHKAVPFQNITVLLQKPGTMDVPDLNQVKDDVLNYRGGLCYTNNVFMKYLLDAVGLKTFHVSGVCNPKHPNNHIATLVCDLQKPGQKHLVDVGCGYPTYQAIELTEVSEIYHSAYLTYCFKMVSPDEYIRYHSIEPLSQPSQKCYEINTAERDLSYFQEAMLEVYKDRFPKKLRAIRMYDDKIIAFRETGNSATKLIFEGSNNLTKVELTSHDAIATQISKILPCFSETEINIAVTNWQANCLN